MPISGELIYMMTRGRSSFHRKNINGTHFTADPFSPLNLTHASQCGFHSRGAVALHPGKTSAQVNVTEFRSRHRITKKGTKKNRKALALTYATKTVDAKKRVSTKCGQLDARGNHLHQAALRANKLNKE